MTIRQQAPPNLNNKPRVDFVKPEFDAAIWQKGYDVIKYDAIQCPCVSDNLSPLTNCQNCLGSGWVFINPIQTKGIITSINKDTKYKSWSPEFKGTAGITLMDVNRVSFMDKIVIKNRISTISEVVRARESGTQKFIFASYPVKDINSIFIFNGADNPLLHLTRDDYDVSANNPYVVDLSPSITFPDDFNNVISIDYDYNVQYNVVDIPHDIRASTKLNLTGKSEVIDFPVHAICQKSHYITGDSPKYDGTGIQDNSYL